MSMMQEKYFCIFGGGGVRGVSYIGVLQALRELGIEIEGCAGSSVGAIFATLFTLGYDLDEMTTIFKKVNFDLFRDINFNLNQGFSLSKGEVFLVWLRELIEKKFYGENYAKGNVEPVKFKDLDKDLVILSVNLTDSKFSEFSKQKTPEVEIAYAIRASVSIPGLFPPVEFGLDYLVDGDLIKSWPLWRVSENLCPKDKRILEFRLEDSQKDKKIDNGISYINAVYNTISGLSTDFIIDLYGLRDKFDYIKINSKNIAILDFAISEKIRENLAEVGYLTTLEYFREFLPKKRALLFESYYKIELGLLSVQQSLKKNNVKEARLHLCEHFVNLCEAKRNIDLEIYNSILEFKNLFFTNYETTPLGFVRLNSKNVVQARLSAILETLMAKTSELRAKSQGF